MLSQALKLEIYLGKKSLEPFVDETMRDTADLLTAVARPQTGIPGIPGISVPQKLANPTRECMPTHPAIGLNTKDGGRIIWFTNSNGKYWNLKDHQDRFAVS